MKRHLIFFLSILPFLSFQEVYSQIYTYDTFRYHERIELHDDGTFFYSIKIPLVYEEVRGNWQKRNDTILVLDSCPQVSNILVKEGHNRKDKGTEINIWREDGRPFFDCSISVISSDNDTISFYNISEPHLHMDLKIKSFYMTDLFGFRTKAYKVRYMFGNKFDIIYNRKRVFENECWIIKDSYIIPRGKDRNYANYTMEKIDSNESLLKSP